jgi:formamidopyrimidine-DNA glycosylase
MPELPEVEVIRRDLDVEAVGKRIAAVEVDGARSVRRYERAEPFVAALELREVVGARRRGKSILVVLDDGAALVVQLGMSGQLRWASDATEPRAKHTHVVLRFDNGAELRFIDPRTFGQMFVSNYDAEHASVGELAHFGPDALDTSCPSARAQFATMLAARTTKLKPLLLDQRFLAGIGNIYSDEILFAAGQRYERAAGSLSTGEVRRLHESMACVLAEGIRNRGSSLADAQYVDLYGRPGAHQHHHQVYAREGEPCRRCRRPITRARFSNRSTFFCSSCQT